MKENLTKYNLKYQKFKMKLFFWTKEGFEAITFSNYNYLALIHDRHANW